ncbi:MAG: 5-(carboxyamino)imidazole ribonucleotide mutase [Leptospiraceae bacterium]|nr:5-(carboxyamino)imidazole ribonucleotide mutase [Leptospiraceae bacterium]MCK6380285.1 5-(carboxyamino)imidazole ribonucleotide mutase [Leptospiraceae bacterium]
MNLSSPKVSVIMGSVSDWETMKEACGILTEFEISYEKKIVSAHRSPDLLFSFAKEAKNRGIKVIIAGAGGAAHLPGMVASLTTLPVLGVPIQSKALNGLDSLYSIVQMPKGIPVASLAVGGAANAGILAVRILGVNDDKITEKLTQFAIRLKEDALSKESDLQ